MWGGLSEAERNQLSSRLNAAYEAGAMDADDYHARLDTLFAAQRMGELVPVVQGLPPLQTYADPAIVAAAPAGRPGELSTARSARIVARPSLSVTARQKFGFSVPPSPSMLFPSTVYWQRSPVALSKATLALAEAMTMVGSFFLF